MKKIFSVFSVVPKWLAWLALFLGFAGFLDALYLTVEHYLGVAVNCVVLSGCDRVLSSNYASVAGVPVALIGTFYYLTLFSGALFFLFGVSKKPMLAGLSLVPFGFLASLWFVYLQFFVIKSICFYCMISATVSTALLAALIFSFYISRK